MKIVMRPCDFNGKDAFAEFEETPRRKNTDKIEEHMVKSPRLFSPSGNWIYSDLPCTVNSGMSSLHVNHLCISVIPPLKVMYSERSNWRRSHL